MGVAFVGALDPSCSFRCTPEASDPALLVHRGSLRCIPAVSHPPLESHGIRGGPTPLLLLDGPQLVRYPTADTTVASGARPSTLLAFNLDSQFVKSQLVIHFRGCGATSPDFHEM